MSEKLKSVTVKLAEPVTVEGITYKELTFRRMKAKDALLGEGQTSQLQTGYKLYAALADVDVAVIEELDMDDFEAVSEKIVPLMGKSAAAAAMKTGLTAAKEMQIPSSSAS